MNLCYLRKSLDGNYYIDNTDSDAAYDINKLSVKYPDVKFIIVNDSSEYPFNNVFSRKAVLKAAGVDDKLRVKCSCGNRVKYNKSLCPYCNSTLVNSEVLSRILGQDYQKAMAEAIVENFAESIAPRKDHNAFSSYVVDSEKDVSEDPFLSAIFEKSNN
jgi:hypothetical protein